MNKGWKTFLACLLTVAMVLGNMSTYYAPAYAAQTSDQQEETTEVTSSESSTSKEEDTTAEELSEEESETSAEVIEEEETTSEEEASEETADEEILDEDTSEETTEAAAATKTTYQYKDKKVTVTAELTDPEAIPDDAELVITPVTSKTKGYNYQAYMDALNASGEEGVEYTDDNSLLYDIAFMGPEYDEDGKATGKTIEYEPAYGSVKISVQFLKKQLSEGLSVTDSKQVLIQHLPLTEAAREDYVSTKEATDITKNDIEVENVEAKVKVGKKETAEFTLEGFSVISVTEVDTDTHTYSTSEINYETVLGDAIEYGIVADRYDQNGSHTETNFAVKSYRSGTSVVEVDLTNDADIPFVIGDIEDSLRFGNLTDSNNIDIQMQDSQKSLVTHDNSNIQITYITKSQSDLDAEVDRLKNEPLNNSTTLSNLTATKVVSKDSTDAGVFVDGKVIDTTRLPDNATIVIDAGTISSDSNFWQNEPIINKLENQNIVINVGDGYGLNMIRNYIVTVNRKEIKTNSQTVAGTDGQANADIDNYILQHIIWNVTNKNVNTIQDSAGLFLFNNDVELTGIKNSAGWIVAKKGVQSNGEWHFIYHKRKYSSKGEALVSAKKIFEGGTLNADQFTFSLKEIDGDGKILTSGQSQEKTNKEDGSVSFDKFSYTQDDLSNTDGTGTGTKRYVIQEEIPEGAVLDTSTGKYVKDGITYSSDIYMVVVKLTDSGNKVINTDTTIYAASYDADSGVYTQGDQFMGSTVTFKNTKEQETKATIQATKAINNWGKADSFTFELAAKDDNAPMPEGAANGKITAKATKSNLTAVFGEITYTEAGTYNYTITEQNDGISGITYNASAHDVTVTVTKASDGTLSAKVTYDNGGDSLTITNKYDAKGTLDVKGKKAIEGRDFKEGDSWTFTISGEDTSADGITKKSAVPLPKDSSVTIHPTSGTSADYAFESINYDLTDVGHTYTYTVKETKGSIEGITYDETVKTFTVTVEDNGDGTLKITQNGNTEADLTFTNRYFDTSINLEATKAFNNWGKADSFTFKLTSVDGAPMPDESANNAKSVVVTNADQTANFGDITYVEAGEYKYTIQEVIPDNPVPGVTYDTDIHKVVVTVTKGSDGTLTAKAAYDGNDSLTITNKFEKVKTHFEVTKDFEDWGKADTFIFDLAAVTAGAPMPEGTINGTASATASKTDPHVATFGDIEYDTVGEYVYKITERNGGADGVTYDAKAHTVTVTVSKDDSTNALTATVKYDDNQEKLTITNTYAATSAELKATKQFNDWSKADSFRFNLAAKDSESADGTKIDAKDVPMPNGTIAVATKDNVEASFGSITYEKAGTYRYTITEEDGKVKGVTYDTTPHEVVVTVTKNENTNELTADVKYDNSESLIITNTYASAAATLQATKNFADWGKADEFTFNLAAVDDAPMPAAADGKSSMTAKATKDATTAVFGTITYEAEGIYEYKITEVNDGVDGVTYDSTAHTVKVNVTRDAATKELTATVTYDGETSLIIKNTYEAAEATLEATKNFSDWGKAKSFTFNLAADEETPNAPMPSGTVDGKATATATEDATLAKFATITYEKAGTYKYTITEVNDGVDGVSYDTTAHKVVVTVTKDATTNKLSASVTYDDENSLTITNKYASTSAELKATKDFADWGKADSFTFNLEAVNNAPMPAGVTDGKVTATAKENSKTVSFGEITYEKAGTYEYTITEVNGGADGVTYDTTAHKAVVEVSKDEKTNKLSAVVTYDGKDSDSLTITNTYDATKASIEATKEFNDWGKADKFTFNLAAVTKDAPMPKAAEGKSSMTATATKDQLTAEFGEITYEKAGTYEYTITEVNDGVDGVSYDTTAHKVVVTVKKDATTNKLSASVTYDGKDSLTITNTYAATSAELKATKQFNDWSKAKSFTFKLAAVDGAPMPKDKDGKDVESAVATETEKEAVFGEITYEKAGTYEYTITEVDDGVEGITYDTTAHKVVVEVTADKDTNKLSADVKYDGAGTLVITNTYASADVSLQATKDFDDWGQASSFTFNLAAKNNAPLPVDESGNSITTAKATEDAKTAVFGTITYKKAGTYEYTITEVNDGVDGVSYDTTSHNVVVTVEKDADNKLIATVKYDDSDSLIITNTFEAAKATLEATKKFENWGKADSFTFNLEAVDDAPMPEGAADGKISANATKAKSTAIFGEITYEKAGTYEYKITEVNDGVDGVTYDTTEHKAVVTVEKGKDNKLTATVKYDEDQDNLEITNTFTAAKATIEATKKFNNWGQAKSFTFNLAAKTAGAPMPKDEDGKTVTSAIATKDAAASFGTIEYDQAGTYEYTITEVNDHVPGVSYDSTAHTVTVTVVKNEKTNALSATVKYDEDKDSLEITNTFTAAKAKLQATKDFDSWGKAENFTFNLAAVTKDAPMPQDTEGNEVTTAIATKDKTLAVFGEISYTTPGIYEYKITETDDHVAGVTYDTAEHKVLVVVSADPTTNELSAVVKYDGNDSLTIKNTYAAAKAELKATKDFNDWSKAESFTFNLKAVDGAPMPKDTEGNEVTTATATEAQRTASFGEIVYEKAGTYEYTITEVNGKVDGVTYDTEEHKVVVTVSADETTNVLSADVTYDGKSSLTISNSYASSSIELQATKEFNDWGKASSFTFNLAAVDEAPMPEGAVDGKISATATQEAQTAAFGKITYEKAGTYKYTITERNDGVDGVTYDSKAHEVVVTVAKGSDNTLTATAEYDGEKSLTITNTYAGTKAAIEATKAFDSWGKASSFTFRLTKVTDGAPMPENTEVIATEANPSVSFGEIEYSKAGTYEYIITEVNDHVDGVTYDTKEHKVVVTVTKDAKTNELSSSVTYDGEKSLIITNSYVATKAEIKATKNFNDWGKADSFTFKLAAVTDGAPLPKDASGKNVTSAVATKDIPTAIFGEITFEKAGTYQYTITEVNNKVDGVTYDTTEHNVVVTVSADKVTNELSAEVKYDGAESLTITNSYASSNATLQATKSFNDWGKASSFTFNLAAQSGSYADGTAIEAKDVPMPALSSATATVDKQTAVFGEVTYEKAGTYNYTITEVKGDADGVTYDTTPHNVVVTVTKGDDNQLTTDVKYDGEESLTITNTYAATKATLQATKEFNDWGKASSFTFDLAAVTNGAPMPAATIASATENNPIASFGEITYEKAGTYVYTITERNDHADGVTYDTAAHTVTVTVTKNSETNELSAAVDYDGADSLTITNTYAATTAKIQTTKNFSDWGAAESFTFNLTAVTKDAPMPKAAEGKSSMTATATKDQVTAEFGEITYEKAGIYEYTITEQDDGADGVTYDTKAHNVIVTVTADKETNALSAAVKYDGAESLTITNTYASAKATLQATKSFSDWGKASSFTFNLAAVTENAPLPKDDSGKDVTSATATQANPAAVFGEITYEKAGTYEYTITERNDGADGVTYDTEAHKVVVTVTKGEDNKLTTSVKYDEKDSLTITNTYAATKATLEATKSFNDWGKASSFTFDLAAQESESADGTKIDAKDVPMPASASATATQKAEKASFGDITFEKAGTYNYTITERNDGVDGVTYDTTAHKVVVTVTKEEKTNALSAAVTYDGGESLTITNTYEATKASIEAKKEFNDWSKAEGFTFTLKAVGDAPLPKETSKTATKDSPTVNFGDITYEKAGDYHYTITEVKGDADGVTYDTTPHDVTVHVTKADGTNKLSAEVTYDNGSKELVITNTYTATSLKLQTKKQFNDWGKADSFTFTLKPLSEDAPMPESDQAVATEENKTAQFGEITYEKAGTYYYTITEKDDGVDGVTYDTTAHQVIVTVVKDADTNKLTASATYDGENALTITNTFADTKAEFKVTKSFNDWGKAKAFTFKLAAVTEGAPMPTSDTVTVDQGHVDGFFGEASYVKAGTYEYTITEVNDHAEGVAYDTTAHKVVVTVTKGDKNQLSANVTYDGASALIVTNTYASAKATLQATKDFSDWGKADEFTFNLTAKSGEYADKTAVEAKDVPMPKQASVKATKDAPTGVFGEIEYERAGTYEYTITEVNDHADGVTYDTTEHKVVVTVTADKETNELTTKTEYDGNDSLIITNTYTATKAALKATKAFNNWGKAQSFTFQLAAVTEGAPMPSIAADSSDATDTSTTEATDSTAAATDGSAAAADANAADNKATATDTADGSTTAKIATAIATKDSPEAVFGEITYEKSGVYEYTITEVNDHADGVTYDETAHKVVVTVTADKETNELKAAVTYDGEKSLTITNAYHGSANVTFEGTKTLTGKDMTDGQFSFTLQETDKDGKAIGDILQTVKAPAASAGTAAKFAFAPITYTTTDVGDHYYTVAEVNDGQTGITYDTTVYTVKVVVTESEDGTITATPGEAYNKLAFTNTSSSETTKYTVTKKWDDSSNKYKKRPTSITVNLLADGEETGKSVKLTASDSWTYTWSNLAKTDSEGNEITYSVEEVEVSGYTADYNEADDGLSCVITNSYDKDSSSSSSDSDDSSSSTSSSSSKTGDISMAGWLGLLLIAAAGVSIVIFRRKKEDQNQE